MNTDRPWSSVRLAAARRTCSCVVGVIATFVGFSAGIDTAPLGAAAIVRQAALPQGFFFNQVVAASGSLEVSGGTGIDGVSNVVCALARMDPATLAVTSLTEGNCVAAAVSGSNAAPVRFLVVATLSDDVRVARIDKATGNVVLGPTVISYPVTSAADLEWAGDAGSLWIYVAASANGAEVVQVSDATGAVVERIPAPVLVNPVIAADQDGVWLAPSELGAHQAAVDQGADVGHCPTAALYHAASGAHSLRVVHEGDPSCETYASWLVASSHTVWSELCVPSLGSQCVIWRFDGSAARAAFHVTASVAGLANGVTVIGSPAGLYSAVATGASGQRGATGEDVVRIDPDSGAIRTLAEVRFPAVGGAFSGLSPDAAVVAGESLYVLVPPTSEQTATLAYTRIDRIAL